MKELLVIGGSYFAGRVFVEEAVRESDVRVSVFNRGRFPLAIDGVSEFVGDRDDVVQIRRAIPARQWDVVIDFCAYTGKHAADAVQAIRGDIGQYILISTTTVYAATADLPVRETAATLTGPRPAAGPHADYGYHKWLAERAAAGACAARGVACTCLRPAIIYGPYNYAPRESYFFKRLLDQQPVPVPEGGLALFNFIWVVDMARLILRCLDDPRVRGETYNLASDELLSYARIIEVLEAITGKPIERTVMPVDVINARGIALPFPLDEHLVYCGEKIRRLFDFEYTPFTTGMRAALQYFLMVKRLERARGATTGTTRAPGQFAKKTAGPD